jgi:hypothetical protein
MCGVMVRKGNTSSRATSTTIDPQSTSTREQHKAESRQEGDVCVMMERSKESHPGWTRCIEVVQPRGEELP